jgi:glycosyltransferase involved in cell wall biosynthesis
MPTCAVLSFRFGSTDGVSVVARRWADVLVELGFDVVWAAGAGAVDRRVPGLAIGAHEEATDHVEHEVADALADADLVLVENLLTIPLNLPASRAVARVLAGRPAILHHHDPPWQRARFAHVTELPADDPAWRHVTINRITHDEMAARGIPSTVVYNAFERRGRGDRAGRRRALGIGEDDLLLAHPVRAIERKNLPAAIEAAERLGATYWLLGPAEEGYGPQLARELAAARCPVVHAPCEAEADIYAAADGVLFPSTWEGFGNPPLEAALYRRPCLVGTYPFAGELQRLGFRFGGLDDLAAFGRDVRDPDVARLDRNQALAEEHFGLDGLARSVRELLAGAGWLP